MEGYLTFISAGLIALAIGFYVLLDGFDLGIGVLFFATRDEGERDQMMNTVAPFWDGNETWLVLGGAGLFVAFPLAYSIIMPGLYLPVILMLLGLIFRGVAFEFRWLAKPRHAAWDLAFFAGSTVAALSQGLVLGGLIQGIRVENGAFSGGPFDWATPFAVLCAGGVVAGYVLLATGWLMMKVEGPLADKARKWARPALALMLGFIVAVSLWTPLGFERVAERWFTAPNIYFLWPVPILTGLLAVFVWRGIAAERGAQVFAATIGLFALSFLGLSISLYPYIVPPSVTIWEAAAAPASQIFVLFGLFALLPLLLFSTAFIYWTFRGKVRPGEGYH